LNVRVLKPIFHSLLGKRFRQAVLASGETGDESVAFFQSVVDEVRSERAGPTK
jgi:hypothetical protein